MANINNLKNATTGKSPNELIYGFKLKEGLNIFAHQFESPAKSLARFRNEAKKAIAFAIMSSKRIYDKKHSPLHLRPGDYAYIQLHKGYQIHSAWNKKLENQYAGPFQVLEKVSRLAYRLKLPDHWRIHPVFSIAHLKPVKDLKKDPYQRPVPDQPPAVYVEGDTPTLQSYELERLMDRRERILRGKTVVEYLVKWKGYGAEHDKWLKQEELGNAKELLKNYYKTMSPAPVIVPVLRLLGTSTTKVDTEPARRHQPKKAWRISARSTRLFWHIAKV